MIPPIILIFADSSVIFCNLEKSKKSNIKPSELRKQGEFYRYSDDIRSELGAPPKTPGAERDAYYQEAFL